MVIFRATKKLLNRFPSSAVDGDSYAALGDWYANRIVIHRKPLVTLISSESLLPILTPARDLKNLPSKLPRLVEERLSRMGTAAHIIDQEIRAISPVQVAPTRDRSVVGMLVTFAFDLSYILGADGWDESHLADAEKNLANTPCRVSSKRGPAIFPRDAAPALLQEKWGTTS